MNDDNPGRRGATKIDGELPTCAQKARPKPQIAAGAASRAGLGRRRLASYGGPTHDCCPGAGIWEMSVHTPLEAFALQFGVALET